jgi:SAM-dependent methyltransferase
MLAVAHALPPPPGTPNTWQKGTAVGLPIPDATFDLVCCQQGLQFFPDRLTALREMHHVLVPGGRLARSVDGALAHNPGTQALAQALAPHGYAEAAAIKQAEHALADAGALRAFLTQAGFHDVAMRPVTLTIRMPSPRAYVQIHLTATPLAAVVGDLDAHTRDALVAEVGLAPRQMWGKKASPFHRKPMSQWHTPERAYPAADISRPGWPSKSNRAKKYAIPSSFLDT